MNDGKLAIGNTRQSYVVHPKHVDLTQCLLCMPLNKQSSCKDVSGYHFQLYVQGLQLKVKPAYQSTNLFIAALLCRDW